MLVGAVLPRVLPGLPPVLKFGSPQMQQRVVPSIVSGEKRICLAISEPYAGMCEFVARGAGIHCVKLCLFSDAALLPSFGVMPRKGSDVAHIKTLARKTRRVHITLSAGSRNG